MASFNHRHPAVKRIVQELKEVQRDDDPDILAEAIEVRSVSSESLWQRRTLQGGWPGATEPSAACPCLSALWPFVLSQDNIFEWHFVIRGAWDSEFEVGGARRGGVLASFRVVVQAGSVAACWVP